MDCVFKNYGACTIDNHDRHNTLSQHGDLLVVYYFIHEIFYDW